MNVYRRALQRVILLKGPSWLAGVLGVPEAELQHWLEGKAPIPGWATARVVDIVLEADLSSLRAAQRVLVVDDDPAGAYGLARVLRRMGHTVETALSGEAAVALARRFLPHVVFLDLRMPDVDACELAARLHAEPSPPRIIAATAYGDPEDRRRTAAAGFEAHLLKPIDAAMLEPYLPSMV